MAGDNCQQHAAHEQRFIGIEKQIEQFNSNQEKVITLINNIVERVTATEQSSRSAHHRLDSQEDHTKAIYELAYEVKSFGQKQEQIIEQQSEILKLLTEHDTRLHSLESQPAESALRMWKWLAIAFAGGIIGMFFNVGVELIKKKLGG